MSGLISDALQTLMFAPTRVIAPLTGPLVLPDCAVGEDFTDEMTITKHPVQTGAYVGDHAYKEPSFVVLRWYWSTSSPNNVLASMLSTGNLLQEVGAITGVSNLFGSDTWISQTYKQLLTLQGAAIPFMIVTPKRALPSMLLRSIGVQNDAESENALYATLTCEQVIIVSTSTATITPQSAQAQPQQTSPVQQQGTANTSALSPSQSESLLYRGAHSVVGGFLQ